LTGTIRTVSERVRRLILDALHSLGTAIEATHGCQVSLQIRTHTPVLQNDEQLTRTAMGVARQLFGDAAVGEIALPSMGAEDFAFFSREVGCCMMRLGTAGTPRASYQAHCSPLHSSDFDIEEDALAVGAQLLAACVIQTARSEAASSPGYANVLKSDCESGGDHPPTAL
jgi:amidohydrolase